MASEADVRRQFTEFFRQWLTDQEYDLQSLRFAAASPVDDDDPGLQVLIRRVLVNYERYYRTKAAAARRNVLPMFSPSWTSSTENLFLWVGGWRPTMAIQLLYSKSGIQFQSRLQELINGVDVAAPDLAGLSREQLELVDELHRLTLQLEKEITEEEARSQEKVADAEMVELSHGISTAARGEVGLGAMDSAMDRRTEDMVMVLGRADRLRIDTLRTVVGILRPKQAAHYLIAAAELHLRVHEFGKNKEAADAAALPAGGDGGSPVG